MLCTDTVDNYREVDVDGRLAAPPLLFVSFVSQKFDIIHRVLISWRCRHRRHLEAVLGPTSPRWEILAASYSFVAYERHEQSCPERLRRWPRSIHLPVSLVWESVRRCPWYCEQSFRPAESFQACCLFHNGPNWPRRAHEGVCCPGELGSLYHVLGYTSSAKECFRTKSTSFAQFDYVDDDRSLPKRTS